MLVDSSSPALFDDKGNARGLEKGTSLRYGTQLDTILEARFKSILMTAVGVGGGSRAVLSCPRKPKFICIKWIDESWQFRYPMSKK